MGKQSKNKEKLKELEELQKMNDELEERIRQQLKILPQKAQEKVSEHFEGLYGKTIDEIESAINLKQVETPEEIASLLLEKLKRKSDT